MKIDSVKLKILPTLRAAGVIRASVFGSVARGDSGPASDIDLLVELPKGKSLLDLVALKLQLEDTTGRNFDVMTFQSIYPPLRSIIERDQIAIL